MKAEPFDKLLTALGIPLTFTGQTIQGFPFFDTKVLYGETTVAQVEAVEYTFSVKTADTSTYTIAEGDIFYITDGTYNYSFDIDDIRPDMTGWSTLFCSYRGKENA